ncbi:9143_t:CDS:2 [Diversispora eburnea]|uniref:9143_t:CDS:1 n=1 Tax=Diversispora eburnea TaxID=1213867 RepID=A0A9N9GJJ2_9GLOM|nr:9143_t:CDS:2 [Diversispora eburnea]
MSFEISGPQLIEDVEVASGNDFNLFGEEMNSPTNSLIEGIIFQDGVVTFDIFSEYLNRVYFLCYETENAEVHANYANHFALITYFQLGNSFSRLEVPLQYNNRHNSQEALNSEVENQISHENPNLGT